MPSLCEPPSCGPKGEAILPFTGPRNLPEPWPAGCGGTAAIWVDVDAADAGLPVESLPVVTVEVADGAGAIGAKAGAVPLESLIGGSVVADAGGGGAGGLTPRRGGRGAGASRPPA